MKKLIFLCLVAVISAGSIFASPSPDASEKILKLFHHDFPEVQKQTIYDYGDYYIVYFKEDENSSCRVFYNLDGDMLKTVKYYSADKLDPFIRAKVDEKYRGKTIYGITEVESEVEHFYQIILQDSKTWYYIKSDPTGSMTLEEKLIKS